MRREAFCQPAQREDSPQRIQSHHIKESRPRHSLHAKDMVLNTTEHRHRDTTHHNQQEKVHQEEQQRTTNRLIRLRNKIVEENRIIEQVDTSRHKKEHFQMAQHNKHEPTERNTRVHIAEPLIALPQRYMQQAVGKDISDILVDDFRVNKRQSEFLSVLPRELVNNPQQRQTTVQQHKRHTDKKRYNERMEARWYTINHKSCTN